MIELSSILKSLDDIVFLIDSKLVFKKYWVADEQMLWIPPDEFIGRSIEDVFPEELDIDVSAKIRAVFETQRNNQLIYSSPNKSSSQWYRVRLNLIEDKDEYGQQYMLLIIGDCTKEVELKSQKRIFEGIISQNWDAIKFLDLDENIQYINPAVNRLYGYEASELIGQHVSILNNQALHTTNRISEIVGEKGFWSGELIKVRKDKSWFNAFVSVQLIRDSSGIPIGYVSHSKDISGEKETAAQLKQIIGEKELLLKELSVFENIVSQNWDAITFANLEGIIQYINPATNRLYGYKEHELIGQNVAIFNSKESHDTGRIIQAIIDTGIWSGEIRQIRKNKTLFEAFLSVQLIKDNEGIPIGYASHCKDITNEKETAKKLKAIISERETLLKEIHHRVKNNLQVITSLLSLQANTINDEGTKVIFQQSQYRINTMAMIHETLYQSEDFLTIGYEQYMEALMHYLILSMKGAKHNIKWSIDAEDVKLNIDTAIPLGLLINEIITNALKYGLEGEKEGKIYIQLKPLVYPNYILCIGDSGKGFSSDINFRTTNSLGLKLIHNLAKQLRGTIERKLLEKGTHYKINFQEVV